MSETVFLPFTDVFDDATKDGTKIPTTQYLPQGKYPIIDQGQAYIAGYTNQAKGLFHDVPVIVFGDHTRALKYVDIPFFLGADGVKVLKPKISCNVKYLYYVLQKQNIPNTGYNRHFKWLKLLTLPIIEPAKQDEIVCNFEKIENLIARRKRQLEKLDLLIKAKFYEMFGDPMSTTSVWRISSIGVEFNVASGGTPTTDEKEYWENGTIPWIGSNMCQDVALYENDGKYITELGYAHSSAKLFESGTVLVALVGATIGKTALLHFSTTTNQNIAGINVNDNTNFTPEFVFYHLQMQYRKFMEIGNGKFKMATLGFIRKLPCICPPIELQNEFAHFVEQTEKIKSKLKQSLEKLELLKQSLLQKYFG